MRWQDERYVRFYTRNTPEWCVLYWQARGLMGLLLREVDRAGILELGKLGLRAVAVAVRAPWEEIEGPLSKLLEDGMVEHREDLSLLVIPNFVEAQECVQSDRARKRTERERARDFAKAKSRNVTDAGKKVDTSSRNVTASSDSVTESPDTASSPEKMSLRAVPCHTVPSRAVPDRDGNGARPPTDESGFDLAWRVWSEAWQARHREPFRRSTDTGRNGDDRILQRLGALALEHGDDAERVLRRKLALYLASPAPWLVSNRHPLRIFEKDWNNYGDAAPNAEPIDDSDDDGDEAADTNAPLTPEQVSARHRKLDEQAAKNKTAREERERIAAELERNLSATRGKT